MTLRSYTPEDKGGILKLLKQGHDPNFSAERFDWLHENNIFAPSNITIVSGCKQIIGFYAIMKKQVLISGNSYIGGKGLDAVVHPAHRCKGIFSQMLRYSIEANPDVDFFFNFANDMSAPGYLGQGWTCIGYLFDYICQVHYDKVLSKEFLAYIGTYAVAGRKNRLATIEKINIEDFINSNLIVPSVIEDRICVNRCLDYIQWRYIENPLHKYRYYVHYRGSSPLVLAVVRPVGDRFLYVLDLIPLSNFEYDISSLVSCWAKDFPRSKVIIWSSTPRKSRKCFAKKPMFNNGMAFFVRGQPNKVLPKSIYDLDQWLITHGDLEFF